MPLTMPRPSRLKLAPLDLGSESFGQRLGRIRRQRGLTQTEIAARVGLIQSLLSAYESDRLRLRADVAARFAVALGVSTDELLGMKPVRDTMTRRTARLVNRLRRIEELSPPDQRVVLRTLDALLERRAPGARPRRRAAAVGG